MYNPIQALKLYFARFSSHDGRSTRAEFWWVMLFLMPGIVALIVVVTTFIQAFLFGFNYYLFRSFFPLIAFAIAFAPLAVRRLHDIDLSGG